ncbi:hypothetical protein TNCV_2471301 [Trichonephila clavipes]|nr:hypothetical protein TNCV_2471301 [Trichonephila clavipes]
MEIRSIMVFSVNWCGTQTSSFFLNSTLRKWFKTDLWLIFSSRASASQTLIKLELRKYQDLTKRNQKPNYEGLNRRSVRQNTELLRHQSSSKVGFDGMLNIWHLNELLRHLNSPQVRRQQNAE